MKICFLSSEHPPKDKRVFAKEAISLAKEKNYEVIHLCPKTSDITENCVDSNVKIKVFDKSSGIVSRFFRIPKLFFQAKNISADVYHCNEVDSWIVGVLIKIIYGKKIIFDVHEHYPSTFSERYFPRILRPLISFLIKILFRILGTFTDYIVLAKKTIKCDFLWAEKKIILIQNFTVLPNTTNSEIEILEKNDNVINLIHLGLFSRLRGWPQLLEALASTNFDFHLYIVGTINDNSQKDFELTANNLGLADKITLFSWLPFNEAFDIMKKCHIGLVLFQPGIQNHTFALPHKMFDYMMAQMPVIAPKFAVEVLEIIEDANCGLLVESDNSLSIKQAIDYLIQNPSQIKKLGLNGCKAVYAKYSWQQEEKKLLQLYENLKNELEKAL